MNYKTLARILLLGSLWGPSYFFIKIGLTELPPLTLCFARFALAALMLSALVVYLRVPFPKEKIMYFHLLVMSIFSMALPITLIGIAELRIDSGLVGVINGMVPIFTVIFAYFIIADQRISVNHIIGISLGFLGFIVLFVPQLFSGGVHADLIGSLEVLGASVCYATGIVYGKRFMQPPANLSLPFIQLVYASIMLAIVAFWFEQPWSLPIPSNNVIAAMVGLSLGGTAIAFTLYYTVLAVDGPIALAMTTYLLPLYAIALGAIFLHEQISWPVYLATALIISGMITVNRANAA